MMKCVDSVGAIIIYIEAGFLSCCPLRHWNVMVVLVGL